MGWKAACILINEREPGYFGTLPQHDSRAARDLIERLDVGSYRSLGLTDFDYGMYPKSGRLVIGAYPGAVIVGHQDWVFGTVTDPTRPLLRNLLKSFPTAELLVMELHSVVNYFGYAYYRDGELKRAYAGSADDGIYIEAGELQPDEQAYFAQSLTRDGQRYFDLQGSIYTADQIGEELVFAMAGKFLGAPLDQFACEELAVEEFEEQASELRHGGLGLPLGERLSHINAAPTTAWGRRDLTGPRWAPLSRTTPQ